MTSQLGGILSMPVSRELREYNTPEQIRILESMMHIADTLNRLELYGLKRLSDKQYQAYLDYLALMEQKAEELDNAK
jgi:hypothetical protein